MKPLLAIVGRPNVGKSTLFNKLIGRRAALVEPEPGVTRDRQYGEVDWSGRRFYAVDTGGFEPKSAHALVAAVRAQAEHAIAEADAIVLVCDAVEGLHPADEEVARILRRSGKPFFIAANKVDSTRRAETALGSEIHRMGAPVFPISAEHGRGIDDLLDAALLALREVETAPEPEVEGACRIAIVGRPNVGKSTLVNRILGEERFVASELPGTTRDSIDVRIVHQGRDYVLTDTAGIRRKKQISERVEAFSVGRSLRSIDRSDVACVLIDATEPAVDQDAKILGRAEEQGRAILIAVNKWDLAARKGADPQKFLAELRHSLPFVSWAPVIFVSAATGEGVDQVLEAAGALYDAWSKRAPTPELNDLLRDLEATHPPPLANGRQVRLYYVAQTGAKPPRFTFSSNRPELVPDSYRRYLVNRLRDAFDLPVPVRLAFIQKRGRRRARTPGARSDR